MKVLVLGDGLLGSELVRLTGWDCISRKKDGFEVGNTNGDFGKIDKAIEGYDVVVNCIGHTDTYSKDREPHWNVNYRFVHQLSTICNLKGKKLVHIGTDQIYAGNTIHEPTEEDVPVHAENWYAYTKLLGDGIVQLNMTNYLLCRGTHKSRKFEWDTAFVDKVGNFDYVDVIAPQIIKLINDDELGIWNLGTELKSSCELIRREFPKIHGSLTPSYVPKKTTLSVKKINEK